MKSLQTNKVQVSIKELVGAVNPETLDKINRLTCSEFRKNVLRLCSAVPPGKVTTYKEIAKVALVLHVHHLAHE